MPKLAGIYYQVYQDAEGHLPVILLHGAGGSYLSWPVRVRRMPGLRVFALDLPGHGNSPERRGLSIHAYAACVRDWMEAVGLSRAVMVGHSMGGAIAITLALESPQHTLGLALLGSATRLRVNPALIEASANPASFPVAVEKVIQWSFSRGAPANLRSLVGRRLAGISPNLLHDDFLACDAFDVSARLGQISCPTLVMCGADDRMTSLRESQALVEAIPGASLQVIAGAGHMVMLEKPDEVAVALQEYIHHLDEV